MRRRQLPSQIPRIHRSSFQALSPNFGELRQTVLIRGDESQFCYTSGSFDSVRERLAYTVISLEELVKRMVAKRDHASEYVLVEQSVRDWPLIDSPSYNRRFGHLELKNMPCHPLHGKDRLDSDASAQESRTVMVPSSKTACVIHHLPAELLIDIIMATRDEDPHIPWKFAQINRHLRTLSTTTPLLWSIIDIMYGPRRA